MYNPTLKYSESPHEPVINDRDDLSDCIAAHNEVYLKYKLNNDATFDYKLITYVEVVDSEIIGDTKNYYLDVASDNYEAILGTTAGRLYQINVAPLVRSLLGRKINMKRTTGNFEVVEDLKKTLSFNIITVCYDGSTWEYARTTFKTLTFLNAAYQTNTFNSITGVSTYCKMDDLHYKENAYALHPSFFTLEGTPTGVIKHSTKYYNGLPFNFQFINYDDKAAGEWYISVYAYGGFEFVSPTPIYTAKVDKDIININLPAYLATLTGITFKHGDRYYLQISYNDYTGGFISFPFEYREPCDGVYLKCLNTFGGESYYLFEGRHNIIDKNDTGDLLYQIQRDNTIKGVDKVSISHRNTERYIDINCSVSDLDMRCVGDFFRSPYVYMLNSSEWDRVSISDVEVVQMATDTPDGKERDINFKVILGKLNTHAF